MYEVDLETGEMLIYDTIGDSAWGFIDAATVVGDLRKMAGRPVTMRLNSPGGSVDEAKAIFNAIERHGNVTISVDSLAASAASFIAMAGKRIVMAENALLMVHNAWTFAAGDAASLRKTADILEKYTEASVLAYAKRTKKPASEIQTMLDEETWLNAKEALEHGFVDEIGNVVVDEEPQIPKAMATEKAIAAKASIAPTQAGSRTPYKRLAAAARIFKR